MVMVIITVVIIMMAMALIMLMIMMITMKIIMIEHHDIVKKVQNTSDNSLCFPAESFLGVDGELSIVPVELVLRRTDSSELTVINKPTGVCESLLMDNWPSASLLD